MTAAGQPSVTRPRVWGGLAVIECPHCERWLVAAATEAEAFQHYDWHRQRRHAAN